MVPQLKPMSSSQAPAVHKTEDTKLIRIVTPRVGAEYHRRIVEPTEILSGSAAACGDAPSEYGQVAADCSAALFV